jgi:hypothetical protein
MASVFAPAWEVGRRTAEMGARMGEAVANYRRVVEEQEARRQERERQVNAQNLSVMDSIYSDPNSYKPGGALDTPEKQTQFEIERNKFRQALGIPVQQNFVDPRQGMLVDKIAKGMLAVKSGVPKSLIKSGLFSEFGQEYVEQQALNLQNAQAAGGAAVPSIQPAQSSAQQATTSEPAEQAPLGTERPQQEPPDVMPVSASVRPVTSYTAGDVLDAIFDGYSPQQTSEDEQRWMKVYSTPQGVAMGMQSTEGRERIHAIGKYAFNLPEELWANDPAGYAHAVSEKNREYNDASRKDKNAALLLKFYDQINESMQQQADPRLLAQQMIAPMQNLGYDGTVEELAEYIASVKSMTAKQTADTQDKAVRTGAYVKKVDSDIQLGWNKFKETKEWHAILAADRDADRELKKYLADAARKDKNKLTPYQKAQLDQQRQRLVLSYRSLASSKRTAAGAQVLNEYRKMQPKYTDDVIKQLIADADAADAQADALESGQPVAGNGGTSAPTSGGIDYRKAIEAASRQWGGAVSEMIRKDIKSGKSYDQIYNVLKKKGYIK